MNHRLIEVGVGLFWRLNPDTCLLDPPSLIGSTRRSWRNHQAQTLKQHYGTLRRSAPDQLAALALAVLHVNVPAGVFQAAILESAVDEDSVVQHQVLVFEDFIFASSHEKSGLRAPPASPLLIVAR
jgi:hypothetical protein